MQENSFSEIKIVKDYQNIHRVIYGAKKWKQLFKE
jgi:hypothetical protein